MNNIISLTIEENNNIYNNSTSNKKNIINNHSHNQYVYREYEKVNNLFVATDRYYITEDFKNDGENIETNFICFNNFHNYNNYLTSNNYYEKIIPCNFDNNYYISTKNNSYIHLIVVDNVVFSLDETEINVKDMLYKLMYNNDVNDELNNKLLETIYNIHRKFTIQLPNVYENIQLDTVNVQDKILLKVRYNELPKNNKLT